MSDIRTKIGELLEMSREKPLLDRMLENHMPNEGKYLKIPESELERILSEEDYLSEPSDWFTQLKEEDKAVVRYLIKSLRSQA